MYYKILIISILLFVGCDTKKVAIGEANMITIFCSEEDLVFVQPVFNEYFSKSLNLPQPERLYELQWKDPIEFSSFNNRHNLVVASLKNPIDESGDLLYKKLFQNFSSDDSLIAIFDLYNKNQLLFGIFAMDVQQLQQQLDLNTEFIMDNLNKNQRKSVLYSAYDTGKNKELSLKIQEWFGYDIFIQKDFKLIKENPQLPFLWIGRGYPYRWLTFHEIELEDISSPDLTWNVIDALLESTLENIEVTKDFRSNELVTIDGRLLPILRGNYYHSESESGGPFFTILFHETDTRYLIVSGFVNYPGHPKISLIKQLEALILDGTFLERGDQ